jgi:hypothetical protein
LYGSRDAAAVQESVLSPSTPVANLSHWLFRQ